MVMGRFFRTTNLSSLKEKIVHAGRIFSNYYIRLYYVNMVSLREASIVCFFSNASGEGLKKEFDSAVRQATEPKAKKKRLNES